MRSTSSRPLLGRESFGLLGNERGAINFLFLLFLLVVAVAAYVGYAWMPHFMRNREVISAMHEAGYQAWRQGDDVLMEMLLQRTDKLVLVDDGDGEYPPIDESMVKITRDSKNVYIDLAYEVPMHFPWINKSREIRFENHVKTDLQVPTR